MEIKEYDKIWQLMEQLDNILCPLGELGEEVPCISTNVTLIKVHAEMLAIELGCEKQ